MAIPWPPPTHIVSRPNVLSFSRSPLSSVQRMRAPVIPKGWPSAIAPPCGLSFSLNGSTPMPRAAGITWAANASLISTMSMSSMLILARFSACFEASMGPNPMNSGSSAESPVETTRAIGLMPSSLARRSDITTTAAAPSLSGHALPAVTVPFSRNAGWSVARTSIVVPGRGPSSLVKGWPSGSGTGMISRSKNPSSRALTAASWLLTANRSCSSREIFSRAATFSAVWPMAM